jgi:hypothetical protein
VNAEPCLVKLFLPQLIQKIRRLPPEYQKDRRIPIRIDQLPGNQPNLPACQSLIPR